MCVVPYSNLPLVLTIGNSNRTGLDSPSRSHHNSGSFSSMSSLPSSFFLNEQAPIPAELQTDMNLLPISTGIMLYPDSEVEIKVGIKAGEMIDLNSAVQLEKEDGGEKE